jgi:hypothetical protein
MLLAARYAHEGGLEKQELFIAEWIAAGRDERLDVSNIAQAAL